MNLHFEPVTDSTRCEVENLRVGIGQEHYIETVSDCMKEADACDGWHPMGIYDSETLVGFLMYGEARTFDHLWLDRLLIDFHYQHRGYGKAVILKFLDFIKANYPETEEIYLSVFDDNINAIHLYRELGFCYNGELDEGGEKVMTLSIK